MSVRTENIIAGLRPDLGDTCRNHLAECAKIGISLLLTSGWRSEKEQMALFTKGREYRDGQWVVVNPQRVVTNAMTGANGPHCRGAAYDVVPIVNEKAVWNDLDLWQVIATQGKKFGLIWGGDWPKFKDMPHFELYNWRDLPLKEF